ncbi:MAG: hypothetical protein E6G22_14105 [Actinobacteria bacterium]|nr:MAG: hypothetical protein E6G22_14105 [Actinomycetota bacterium]
MLLLKRLLLGVTYWRWARSVRRQSDELRAAWAYQATDRRYELVNKALRGQLDLQELSVEESNFVVSTREALEAAINRGRTPCRLTVFRGVRDFRRWSGGVRLEAGETLVGQELVQLGFSSTSLSRRVVEAEFAERGTGALLRISLPRGSPAAWLAGVGDPRHRRQMELLLPHLVPILVTRVRRDAGFVLVECEVRPEQVRR